jgi:non-ribosomal peptide synthetase component F
MRGGLQRRRLQDDLRASLDASRLQHGVTAYVLLLTAFKVLLRRLSDSNEILLGTDVAVRETDAIQPLIGMFVNHIPLRTRIDPRMTFSEAVGQVRETTLRAWANRNVPAQYIGRAPLFRVLFDLQDYRLASPPESHLQVRRLDTSWTTAKYDVSLFMEEESGSLTATLEYNTDVLLGHSAGTLLRQYVRLLEQVVRDPDLPLGQYALLEEQAEQGLAAAFNENLQAQEEA